MSQNKKTSRIRETLLQIGAIDEKNITVYSSRTRDNSDLTVYKDIKTDVIFIDDYYVGDEEYTKGAYRGSSSSQEGLNSYEDEIDTNRRLKSFQSLFWGKNICDFGCGAGNFLKTVRPFTASVQGVELQNNLRESLNARDIPCYESINEVSAPLDMITLFHCLEHLPDPLEILNAIHKKLIASGGGLLVVEVPHARDILLKDLRCDDFIQHTLWSQHLVLHTRESLRLLLSYAGFKNIIINSVQRYNIANHLHWMSSGRPRGHTSTINRIESPELLVAYANALSNMDANDTLVAIAKVEH
jgi:2-polyprenyl-3-methyl-5-hydroxy-6-metoxy-1,4-benzoquinol methylase